LDKKVNRAFLVVMDGVGVGKAPDASLYGDSGSDTLGNLAKHFNGLNLPSFQKVGLGNLSEIEGVKRVDNPVMSFGRLQELSAGKDSITGHWELCGLVTDIPFPTYEKAFPKEIVELVQNISGRKAIGNEVASGTEIMMRLGPRHVDTGDLILYTSADSVLQILAHEDIVSVEEQYRICSDIHNALKPPHRVGRVIARPFIGENGAFERTPNRKDYAVEPRGDTVLDVLVENGIDVHGIGKVDTLFAGRGFTTATHTKNNAEGIDLITNQINSQGEGLTFANLLDFDQAWGHRNDTLGFKGGMEELDTHIEKWINLLGENDLLIISADHGNDPTTPSTDHSREHVPLLAVKGNGKPGVDLGTRDGFIDVASTIADHFNLDWNSKGKSFYDKL